METQIAASVLKRIHDNGGVHVPPDIIPNRFIHCIADNLDFSEDNADGRKTLHGTIVTVYRVMKEPDIFVSLSLVLPNECRAKSFHSALPTIITLANPPN